MKTYEFNNQARNIEFQIVVNATDLQEIGWDFDSENLSDYAAIINVSGEAPNNISTTVELNKWENQRSRISTGVAEETGDDEQTIKDIIAMLNDGTASLNVYGCYDNSTDENYKSVPTFIEK